jgi:hypothetical protein
MKVSLERKVLIGALGLGALAFVLDRMVFSAGADADEPARAADASAYVVKSSAGPQVPPKVNLGNQPRTISLAGRLRAAAAAARVSAGVPTDAFMPSPAWQTVTIPEEPTTRLTAQFAARHHLNGVLASSADHTGSSSGGGHALVDGKIIAVGQLVDGFRLVSVSHRSAAFESADGRVVLEMDHSAAMPVSAANP